MINYVYKITIYILILFSCSAEKKDNIILFQTNERMISSLYSQLDIEKPMTIFESIFKSLEENVIVYPSENYYYFKFFCQGQLYIGSFLFSASNRDSGFVYFGYSQKIDRKLQGSIKPNGNALKLSQKIGVEIKKISAFSYKMHYKDKTVTFVLNHPKMKTPKKAKLMNTEEYVGPSIDESGMQFYLVFDKQENHLFWILNEDVYVPDDFKRFDDILIGKRTSFAFYNDSIHHRKILIAVSGWNLYQNNWFDGPFDQLPDNYIYSGELQIKKYIEAAYPSLKGKINKYGEFLNESGRAAVIPYKAYYEFSDLNFVKKFKSEIKNRSKFYSLITQND